VSAEQVITTGSRSELRVNLIRQLRSLMEQRPGIAVVADDLLDVVRMLKALPLSTGEFGLALNRIKNAHRYLVANEPGAARFELRLLLGSVHDRGGEQPIRRSFRRSRVPKSGSAAHDAR